MHCYIVQGNIRFAASRFAFAFFRTVLTAQLQVYVFLTEEALGVLSWLSDTNEALEGAPIGRYAYSHRRREHHPRLVPSVPPPKNSGRHSSFSASDNFHIRRSRVIIAINGGEAPAVILLADQMQTFKDLSLTAVTSRILPDKRTLTAMVPSRWMPILYHRSVQTSPFTHLLLISAGSLHFDAQHLFVLRIAAHA